MPEKLNDSLQMKTNSTTVATTEPFEWTLHKLRYFLVLVSVVLKQLRFIGNNLGKKVVSDNFTVIIKWTQCTYEVPAKTSGLISSTQIS